MSRVRVLQLVAVCRYGVPELITKSHDIAVPVLKYILENEFPDGRGQWPSWWWGVSSMYAIEIGVNLAIDDFEKNPDMLDVWPFRMNKRTQDHAHIHSWHVPEVEIFSKVQCAGLASDEVRVCEC